MRILIADADVARAQRVTEACRAGGHDVERVSHGAAALEVALDRLPDLVICPVDLAMIDGSRLAEILRSNPRTRRTSFLFLVKDELDSPLSMDPLDASVVAPWTTPVVLSHVEAVLRRNACFGEVRAETGMEGKLHQIAVVDLLQLFHANRGSGTLHVLREGASTEDTILLSLGQVVDANVRLEDGRRIVGEKALYRILTWSRGRFEFIPGETPEAGRISKPMQALLLEGIRQLEDWEKDRDRLPGPDTRVRLRIESDPIPSELPPKSREVIVAVQADPRVADILDGCALPDYEVLCVLRDLLARGILVAETPPPGPEALQAGHPPLYTPEQEARLQEWAGPRRGSTLKVLVIAAGAEVLRVFTEALRQLPEFQSSPRWAREPEPVDGLAVLGRFPLGQGRSLRLLALSAEASYAPLRDLAAHGMLGAVIVSSGPKSAQLSAACARLQAQAPARLVHLLVPDSTADPSAGVLAPELDPAEKPGVFVWSSGAERLAVLRALFEGLLP